MSKNENSLTVCSDRTLEMMMNKVVELYHKDKYVRFSWKVGPLSSMPQKALIHIWFRKWVAFLYKKSEDLVTDNEIEGMKRSVKARYYHATAHAFMVEEIADPMAPDRKRTEYTSIAGWERGECFAVMEWMQDTAAERGLILEAEGEFKKLKKQET